MGSLMPLQFCPDCIRGPTGADMRPGKSSEAYLCQILLLKIKALSFFKKLFSMAQIPFLTKSKLHICARKGKFRFVI